MQLHWNSTPSETKRPVRVSASQFHTSEEWDGLLSAFRQSGDELNKDFGDSSVIFIIFISSASVVTQLGRFSKCVTRASLTFSSDRIFFSRFEWAGKTNLLEAIGLAGTLRSFRKSGMDGLVREGSI